MSTYRITWSFVEANGASWNEVMYTDDTSALSAATPTAACLAARLALLHPLNKLKVIRATQVNANRVTGQYKVNRNGTAKPGTTDGASSPIIAGAAAVIGLVAQSGASRKLWLRGIPSNFIFISALSGADSPPAQFTDALSTYFKALQASPYGIINVQPQTPGPLANVKITKVDGSAGTGISTVTLAGNATYPFPGRVIIGGCSKKDLPGLNGRWSLVAAAAGQTFQIAYQTPLASVVTGGNGKCRQESYTTTSIFQASACAFSYYSTRSTRNPTTGSRGARRAVRIRTSL